MIYEFAGYKDKSLIKAMSFISKRSIKSETTHYFVVLSSVLGYLIIQGLVVK